MDKEKGTGDYAPIAGGLDLTPSTIFTYVPTGFTWAICEESEVHPDALSISKNGKTYVWCEIVRAYSDESSFIAYRQVIEFPTCDGVR